MCLYFLLLGSRPFLFHFLLIGHSMNSAAREKMASLHWMIVVFPSFPILEFILKGPTIPSC